MSAQGTVKTPFVQPAIGAGLLGCARGVALLLGVFSLLNMLGELRATGFDANIWWIDFRPLPRAVSNLLLICASALAAAFAIRPRMPVYRRWATAAVLSALIAVTLRNSLTFYVLFGRGRVASWFPFPLSLLLSFALMFVVALVLKQSSADPQSSRRINRAAFAGTSFLCIVGFPLAQVLCFGTTDYRRTADAIVVFGARVWSDGTPSPALEERVYTACELYRDGWAPRLIFSGGPGPKKIDEAQAMRQLALKLGVPAEAMTLDPQGINTQATVENTVALCRGCGIKRVLAVSHFYHLPRVKMTFQRAGWEVYTVPAAPRYVLVKLPYFIAREVAALWAYYLRPLAG